jgi:Uma2 family endonuclease
MSNLMLELRPRQEQTAFNLKRWDEVLADPLYRKIEGRIETDRHGRVLMSPPPAPRHGRHQSIIASLLTQLMPTGETITECPISTADGVRAADVAWVSDENWRSLGNRACFIQAPEICVEIISPSNSEEEIREKMALYFDAGAQEVWICGVFGQMNFHAEASRLLSQSALCPKFPNEV